VVQVVQGSRAAASHGGTVRTVTSTLHHVCDSLLISTIQKISGIKRVRNWYCSPPPRLYLAPTSAHQGERRRSLLFGKGTRRATSRRMRREWQAQHTLSDCLSAFGSPGSYFLREHTVRVDIFRAEEEEPSRALNRRGELNTRLPRLVLVLNLTDLFEPVQTSPSPELHQLARYSDVTSSKLNRFDLQVTSSIIHEMRCELKHY
jgi:hypothetical protein